MNPDLRDPPSALQAHLGYELTGWQVDWARVEIPLAAYLMNRQGIPHGGIHATLLDTAMGYALCYTGDPGRRQMVMTLSLSVAYMGQPGDGATRLIAEGRRSGGGSRTAFAAASLRDDLGRVIAEGTGVFRYRTSA
jgi:uncharacterized protein (TIGR00369 family)